MAFKVACSVLSLPVRLIIGLTIDERASVASTSEIHVDVLDMYDEPAVQAGEHRGRGQVVGDSVQPDACLTETYFAVDHGAVGCSIDAV